MFIQNSLNNLYNLDVRDAATEPPAQKPLRKNSVQQILTERTQLYFQRSPRRRHVVVFHSSPGPSFGRHLTEVISESEDTDADSSISSNQNDGCGSEYYVSSASSQEEDGNNSEASSDSLASWVDRRRTKFSRTKSATNVEPFSDADKSQKCEKSLAQEAQEVGLKRPTQSSASDGLDDKSCPNLKRHDCPDCGRKFRYPVHVARHQRTVHAGERPYACPLCSKAFTRKEHVERHLLHHSGQRPHQCKQCSMRFSSKSNLNTHMRLHDTAKRALFECSFCKRRFSSKYNRDDHQRIHTGERPFSCQYCGKRYASKSSLNSHWKRGCSEED